MILTENQKKLMREIVDAEDKLSDVRNTIKHDEYLIKKQCIRWKIEDFNKTIQLEDNCDCYGCTTMRHKCIHEI